MGIVLLIIIGTAAGFLATRAMRLDADVPTTIAIGVAGTLVGSLSLRALALMAGWMTGFVGAVIGSIILICIWKTYVR